MFFFFYKNYLHFGKVRKKNICRKDKIVLYKKKKKFLIQLYLKSKYIYNSILNTYLYLLIHKKLIFHYFLKQSNFIDLLINSHIIKNNLLINMENKLLTQI